jgi:hydroxyacylglutathione hydrolase
MLLRTIYDRELAQASYLIACQQTGEALVVDPPRDLTPILAAAAEERVRITHVTETHIHADFVSGLREVVAATGARAHLSAEGGPAWRYAYADADTIMLRDGNHFMVGNVRIDVLHTPGHTPEHLCFLVTDTRTTSQPYALLSGDCLFIGDVGRPDLLETAAGVANSKHDAARQQFYSIQRLRQLPDYLTVLPGHGAGSACGKALGSLPSSALGYEKLFNPAFQFTDPESFAAWLLDGQPETPRYFGRMKQVNQAGPALLGALPPVEMREGFILHEVLRNGDLVIDTRPAEAYNAAHLAGTINIPPSSQFNTYAGWFIDYDRSTYLIATAEAVPGLVRSLRAIGVDDLPAFFPRRNWAIPSRVCTPCRQRRRSRKSTRAAPRCWMCAPAASTNRALFPARGTSTTACCRST